MLEGSALFAGVKEFTAKSGVQCRICKLVNGETGEMAEIFLSNDCSLPKGLAIMAPVKIKVDWVSFGKGTSFNLVEVVPGVAK